MTQGLLFSKDRALQLDACLASFYRHVSDARMVQMTVIYRGSTDRLRGQYAELAHDYAGRVRFLEEERFRQLVLHILESEEALNSSARGPAALCRLWRGPRRLDRAQRSMDCVLFLVDDTLFVSPFNLGAAEAALRDTSEALGFSLRLGRNTTRSYVLDRQQRLPTFEDVGDGVLRFKWAPADGDFGYPLEVSSSLYRLRTIRALARRSSFTDPNTLESALSQGARRLTNEAPYLLCFEQSVAFSAPVNRVQEVYKNRAGEKPQWSTESLADKFDRGLRLDVAALDHFVPTACHQEVEFRIERRAARPPAG